MDRTSLEQLSKDELIELVLRLQRPDKTSRTSSKPPSTDKKAKRENARPGGAMAGHEPHNRKLCDNPDAFVDHMPEICAICGDPFIGGATGALIGSYDEIDTPPVKPHVVRHRRYSCRCQRCGAETKAPAPAVATSTPFGPRIHALAVYFKCFHALSYERLCGLFRDVFGLAISEGAVMNMFVRARLSAQHGLSPAMRPAFGSKAPTLIIGFSIARMRSCISPIIPAPHALWKT